MNWRLGSNHVIVGVLAVHLMAIPLRGDSVEDAVAAYQHAMQSSDRAERLNSFHRAELLFRKAIEDADGSVNAEMYVNLGTACLSGERLGSAIVAYRKALLLDSSHEQARQNIRHAREQLPDWVQATESNSIFQILTGADSRSACLLVASLSFLAACLLFAAGVAWKKSFFGWISIVPLLFWASLLFLACVPLAESRNGSRNDGVVVRDDVIARSADSTNATPRFGGPLPNGTEVRIIGERDSWLHVRVAGETAWVPRAAIERITLESS